MLAIPPNEIPMYPVRARRTGFSLLEMLIAVAVLGVLGALIFPVIRNAMKSARLGACIHNLRMIGKASAMYSAENNFNIVPASVEGSRTLSIFLAPYAGGMKTDYVAPDIFYCPENEAQKSPPKSGYKVGDDYYKGWSGYFLSYAINLSVHNLIYLEPDERAGGAIIPRRRAVKLTEVQLPSKTVSLMDLTLPWPQNGPPPTSTFANATYFNPLQRSFALGLQHRKAGNILFVDGHVESFTGSRPLPVASLPDQTSPWYE